MPGTTSSTSPPRSGEGGGGSNNGEVNGTSAAPPPPSLPRLPVLLQATVVKGFGRGSKLLGIPTANLDMAQVGTVVDAWPCGIYYGWARLRGATYKAVSSIGWNPQFNDLKQKTVEPHLIHTFEEDFYGESLSFLVCGYVRPEQSYPSLDALIEAIHNDIAVASKALDEPAWRAYSSAERDWTGLATT